MDGAPEALPQLCTPAEVAQRLRCSEWWVKEQARRRRIPYCRIGGSYRFTEERVAAVVRMFEVKPEAPLTVIPAPVRAADRATSSSSGVDGRLRARPPRRLRNTNQPNITAA